MLGTIYIQRRWYSQSPRNFWCLLVSIISIHLERQLFCLPTLQSWGNKIITSDLSLAGHGFTAISSQGPRGYRALPGESLLQQLKAFQPLAVLLPLCQSSAPQPLLQQLCLTHGGFGGCQSLPGCNWGPGPCVLLRRWQHPKPPEHHSHKPIFQVPFPPRHAGLAGWETSCSTVHCELILSCRH